MRVCVYVHDILGIRCELRKSKLFVSVKCTAHGKWKFFFVVAVFFSFFSLDDRSEIGKLFFDYVGI